MRSRRVGVFGWGIVAPKSPNIDAFASNLASCSTWLQPFNGFGPDNFLVGMPEFCFADYRDWIEKRFPPRRFAQLSEKMDLPSLYAIGGFIQALQQNPGMEQELQSLGIRAHVYVGTGLGNLDTIYTQSIELYRSQRRWEKFWSQESVNTALREHKSHQTKNQEPDVIPPDPNTVPPVERESAEEVWCRYWTGRSPELKAYLRELAGIESLAIEGNVDSSKLRVLREKERLQARLQDKWGCPDPPWRISPNVIWNLHNTPAAQISMIGKITGLCFAPVAACSTFGVCLKLGIDAIVSGDANAVVVGATDPPPHPLVVGAFYGARVISADALPSIPLTRLSGTHVAGGAVIWILADYELMKEKGFTPLGMEPLAVGVSSDAYHIITPTTEGPRAAILSALSKAQIEPAAIATWDLHATATPGDYREVATFRSVFPDSVLVTARKGTFGHGMSAGGGWELTAQYLGYAQGRLFPTPMTCGQLNDSVSKLHKAFIFDREYPAPDGAAGKLSMGIGGINACVISQLWKTATNNPVDKSRSESGRR